MHQAAIKSFDGSLVSVTALTHVMVGAGTLLASLFTDYRSYKQQREHARRPSEADLLPTY